MEENKETETPQAEITSSGSAVERIVIFVDALISAIEYQIKLMPHRPKLFWNKLWVREDEFHSSTDMDHRVLLAMNKEDRKTYIADLCRRRQIAHDRDLER